MGMVYGSHGWTVISTEWINDDKNYRTVVGRGDAQREVRFYGPVAPVLGAVVSLLRD